MIPWQHLDTAQVPGDGEDLRLMRRGTEFSIMTGGIELMNSRLSGSEEAMAALAFGRVGQRLKPRVLIGGLGMGFTLRAALAAFGPDAEIVVVELVPGVVAWARGPLADLHGDSLDDPRVSIHQGDVGEPIRAGEAAFDAILLDVDNGPGGLSRKENDGLYSPSGLAAAKRALRPGGVLEVWSSTRDSAFTTRLKRAGYGVEEIGVRAHKGRGARHVIWLATKL
ncbi:spermidine synthase [Caulobacter sp. BE254]|jgi:spermidine synthase|uniref:spermine/spermidine synthase domain-containing protein n=1 Tax=Caulobacter sp. BE254 TaxID=2817720 RepID=UPI0028634851|nr:spermidine synthase [Caulobacter sp. BE254]MDR7114808.1 spermidine synthase [Caulobacter sp. BE254]